MGWKPDHKRMKRPIASPPNAVEERHMARVAGLPCFGCGVLGVELHHSLTARGKRCRRDHRFILPLCPRCHRGSQGVHGIGSENEFGLRIGKSLGGEAERLWAESQDLERKAA